MNPDCLVVGPGAMGCLLAARLSEKGARVSLFDHRADRAKRLSDTGIRIEDAVGARTVRVPALSDADGLPPFHVIFICVKAYQTKTAASRLAPVVAPDSIVVTMQNGLGNVETIRELLPARRVVCSATGQGATLVREGHVRNAGDGGTFVADASDTAERGRCARAVADILSGAGMSVSVAGDWRSVAWSKVVINAGINPVSAIWGVRNGDVYAREDLRETAIDAVCEGAAVAGRKGIILMCNDPVEALREACERTKDNVSSMLQDVRAGRRTEIREINGVLVGEAERLGLAVPTNAMLLERVLRVQAP